MDQLLSFSWGRVAIGRFHLSETYNFTFQTASPRFKNLLDQTAHVLKVQKRRHHEKGINEKWKKELFGFLVNLCRVLFT